MASIEEDTLFTVPESEEEALNAQKVMIRTANNVQELEKVMALAVEEGWNVGRFDARAYFKAFPTGCTVLVINREIVGGIFLAKYNHNFTFIGLFIIDENQRSKGFGKLLWNKAMDQLERNAGLYAVPAQISRYQASGFQTLYSVQRWFVPPHAQNSVSESSESERIIQINKTNTDLIDAYDISMFPAPRSALIKAMLEMQKASCFVIRESSQVLGYGLIRQCQRGYRIGPLYAKDLEGAKELTLRLMKKVCDRNENIIFDTPSPAYNRFIKLFTEFFNLSRDQDADTNAMFKRKIPSEITAEPEKSYAICSLELG